MGQQEPYRDQRDDGYRFQDSDSSSPDVEQRRWAIIFISKHRLRHYGHRLLEALATEHDEGNRRHIVRALGNLGLRSAIPALLGILQHGLGLIVGDAAEAVGKLRVAEAKPLLQGLVHSPVPWTASKAVWALKRLEQR